MPRHLQPIALALLGLTASVQAATFTWVGGALFGPTSWATPQNWLGGVAPLGNDQTALVFGGPASFSFNDMASGFKLNRIQASGSASVGGLALQLSGVAPVVDVAAGGVLALGAPLVGATGWAKTGGGVLALGGNNGGLTTSIDVQAGRLETSTATALGAGRIGVAAGAELRTVAGQYLGGIAGAGSWLASGATTLGGASPQTFAGALSGLADLRVSGPGRQTFSGSMNHVGTTTVDGGDLALAGAAAVALGGTALQVQAAGQAAASGGARWTVTGATSVSSVVAGTDSRLLVDSGAAFTTRSLTLAEGGAGRGRLALTGAASRLKVEEGAVIGRNGTGLAQIDAGRANSMSLTLAELGGSSGVLDLTGGAQWQVGGVLSVGQAGNGQLGVAGGSRLDSMSALLASLPGSDGRILLDGAGSTWLNNGTLTVGASGQGLLGLTQGASASTATLTAGSQLTGRGHLQLGTNAQLAVQGLLTLGVRGQSWLEAAGGAQLTSGNAVLGGGTGSLGSATLDGAFWTVADLLTLGGAGQADMQLKGGAMVETGRLDLSSTGTGATLRLQGSSLAVNDLARLGGGGSLTLDAGGVFAAANLDLGALGTTGTLATVNSGARLNATTLRVGPSSVGELVMQGGATLYAGTLAVGGSASGSVTARGQSQAALLQIAGDVSVGGDAQGVLALLDGSVMTSGGARIGGSGGSATVEVAGLTSGGQASSWTVGGDLAVGVGGGGASLLKIHDHGGVFVSGLLTIGATGTVSLAGGDLSLAGFGSVTGRRGRLDWTGGALHITGPDGATLGVTPYLPRVLVLQGDQMLDVSHNLAVGDGTLVLADQARLRAATLTLAGGQIVGSSIDPGEMMLRGFGNVTSRIVGGQGGALTADGGVLAVGQFTSTEGLRYDGRLQALADSRLVLQSAGLARLGGDALLEAGSALASVNGIELAGGALVAAGPASVIGAFVNEGQAGAADGAQLRFLDAVSGAGSYFGDVAFAGRFAPVGAVQAEQVGFLWSTDLVLDEHGAAAMLNVSGLASLAGDLYVDFGGRPVLPGQVFQLMTWGERAGSFSQLQVLGLGTGLSGQFAYGEHALSLTIAGATGGDTPPVPEPAPAALLAAGLAALGLLARRRLDAVASVRRG